ncbi:MAG: hypothetical protein HZC14_01230 [Candidatus Niyogibacteria bacterium]|nr:hypothetical protein [Candidatus Niyogibacteria bacterium]
MIYFLYGKDTYRSRQNLGEIVRGFLGKGNASHHFFRVNTDNFDPDFFGELARSSSMFGGKYLISTERILSDPGIKKIVLDNLESVRDSDNIFIFWEEDTDKETADKIARYAKKTQEFLPISGVKLKNWIRTEADKLKFNISEAELSRVALEHDSDLWAIRKELEALPLGHISDKKNKLSADGAGPMFDLTDAVLSRNREQAIDLFEKYKNKGVPAEEILWRLLWQAKTLFTVKKLAGKSPATIKKITGLHEYVIKKSLDGAARFRIEELDSLFRRLLDARNKSNPLAGGLDYGIFYLLLKL